ncbi:MAG: hypothetical protein ACXVDA_23370, partial [Ktedonobacterales bacterium]
WGEFAAGVLEPSPRQPDAPFTFYVGRIRHAERIGEGFADLTNSVYLTPSRSWSKAQRCMASDKPGWTEPSGWRLNGQCKFQWLLRAMVIHHAGSGGRR